MRGVRFVPARLDVARGDTVEWENADIVPHTATANDSSWDSGNVPPGSRWRLVVRGAGSIGYRCRYHPTMTAKLVAR